MVGCWNFGKYRRERMRESGAFAVTALCDCNPEWLAAASAEEGGAKTYTHFSAMLSHPGLEAVVISTGADSHTRFASAAMHAGLQVFIEKPLCHTAAECDQLQQVQRATGCVIGVGHNHCRTDGLMRLAKESIESGKLGTVVKCAIIGPRNWRFTEMWVADFLLGEAERSQLTMAAEHSAISRLPLLARCPSPTNKAWLLPVTHDLKGRARAARRRRLVAD